MGNSKFSGTLAYVYIFKWKNYWKKIRNYAPTKEEREDREERDERSIYPIGGGEEREKRENYMEKTQKYYKKST